MGVDYSHLVFLRLSVISYDNNTHFSGSKSAQKGDKNLQEDWWDQEAESENIHEDDDWENTQAERFPKSFVTGAAVRI